MLHWQIFRFLNVNSYLIEGNTLSINWKFTYKYSTLWKKLFKKVWSWLARVVGWELRGQLVQGHLLIRPQPLLFLCPEELLFSSSPSGEADSPSAPGLRVAAPLTIHRFKNEHVKWFITRGEEKKNDLLGFLRTSGSQRLLVSQGMSSELWGPELLSLENFTKTEQELQNHFQSSMDLQFCEQGWLGLCYLQPGLPNSSQWCLLTTVDCFFQVWIQNLRGPRAKWKCGVSWSKLLRISRRWLHSIKARAGPFIASETLRVMSYELRVTYWWRQLCLLPLLVPIKESSPCPCDLNHLTSTVPMSSSRSKLVTLSSPFCKSYQPTCSHM